MKKKLISEVMREISHKRMVKMTPEQRADVARQGGKARWAKLSKAEQDASLERLKAGRKRAK